MPTRAPVARGRGMQELFVLVSIVLLVASLALAAGVFLYTGYLRSSAASKVGQLERAKAAFEPSLIHELTRLDDRMRAAGGVLGGHIAPSAFFRMLEQTTISSLAYTSLDFEAAEPQRMNVKMDGVARSVNSIALQADLFAKGGMITSPIFSNINREADGVHFSLSALVNPVAINFTQLLAGAGAGVAMPPSAESSPFNTPDPLLAPGSGAAEEPN
ncbi:hypothetical protein A3C21_03365 [Candidatus Kaiserbacteria bacterium RIFCSPHIGHO2_02_FULL_59_21]|uniref:Uncharacterized protein n=1 Tax=Candidatus Kaiserbacteria bacterium RIFCSPHIGHO2_02_FULL_59_21 TaxID=1798500 RepID=A0A1F6DZC7_9BACT|nr:MAG: hypothetical protein A2766_04250 [Candidatus Kaiserbacteria bacterium RIFCSPHIGHO2_01_FULL_58_22]OGG66697.1 MAG: hypothetical protein A3C21_03365 [Candidatus Kaiserbacteria bacterium RIFCSPHIGHO2_02_FULL_59_21]OGG79513.1 MAG: hypothetical protein A2952_00035 [Candidatus Kaiserbacteria bacterium RIFCSPLOWO2_01_FULL_59_34]OGG84446.1 MAG: hypothetical protein A3I47_02215 [Candidatus Kaiserbacteria bacterium RIFCSPLOWO2_02_FULL_59_19]